MTYTLEPADLNRLSEWDLELNVFDVDDTSKRYEFENVALETQSRVLAQNGDTCFAVCLCQSKLVDGQLVEVCGMLRHRHNPLHTFPLGNSYVSFGQVRFPHILPPVDPIVFTVQFNKQTSFVSLDKSDLKSEYLASFFSFFYMCFCVFTRLCAYLTINGNEILSLQKAIIARFHLHDVEPEQLKLKSKTLDGHVVQKKLNKDHLLESFLAKQEIVYAKIKSDLHHSFAIYFLYIFKKKGHLFHWIHSMLIVLCEITNEKSSPITISLRFGHKNTEMILNDWPTEFNAFKEAIKKKVNSHVPFVIEIVNGKYAGKSLQTQNDLYFYQLLDHIPSHYKEKFYLNFFFLTNCSLGT
ncbi:hypothetical protein RFI_12824 [Reticulomyxa filosa]|uniref:Uncharacterized protein n=1 Tax=Reticulomyxa filosa TaxID=46433 RepID=X6NED9_RETFI|nr:hypothetical protein RFI_12824 [Reticulomyxa filosa]|eukprot:ETO24331.1 hypothetical protein RFI_12824 [Reticulomyxa filosa]